jgi:hypothetical protein
MIATGHEADSFRVAIVGPGTIGADRSPPIPPAGHGRDPRHRGVGLTSLSAWRPDTEVTGDIDPRRLGARG